MTLQEVMGLVATTGRQAREDVAGYFKPTTDLVNPNAIDPNVYRNIDMNPYTAQEQAQARQYGAIRKLPITNKEILGRALMGGAGLADFTPIAGTFAGVKAVMANKQMLKKAKELMKSGVSRAKIWKDTGWFKDVDKKWKFEIDDRMSTISPIAKSKKGVSLPDVVRHKELYENYPQLEKTDYRLGREGSGGSYQVGFRKGEPVNRITMGLYTKPGQVPLKERQEVANKEMREINVKIQALKDKHSDLKYGTKEAEEVMAEYDQLSKQFKKARASVRASGKGDKFIPDRSLSLHETQHNIQGLEGFEGGGSPSSYGARAYENYLRRAGEAEARNVQTRMNYTPSQRRKKPPWETLDVPEDELTISGLGERIAPGRAYSIGKQAKPLTLEQFKGLSSKGRLRTAFTPEEDYKNLLTGKVPAADFDFNDLGGELAEMYELGTFTDSLKKKGAYVIDDMMGNVVVGKTKRDAELLQKAVTPYERGKAYGYSEEDIANFYTKQRGGGDIGTELGYKEFVVDRARKPTTQRRSPKNIPIRPARQRMITTEDGYKFYEQPDGHWTDTPSGKDYDMRVPASDLKGGTLGTRAYPPEFKMGERHLGKEIEGVRKTTPRYEDKQAYWKFLYNKGLPAKTIGILMKKRFPEGN